jgi:hypothetical protein
VWARARVLSCGGWGRFQSTDEYAHFKPKRPASLKRDRAPDDALEEGSEEVHAEIKAAADSSDLDDPAASFRAKSARPA